MHKHNGAVQAVGIAFLVRQDIIEDFPRRDEPILAFGDPIAVRAASGSDAEEQHIHLSRPLDLILVIPLTGRDEQDGLFVEAPEQPQLVEVAPKCCPPEVPS